jgi:hypothetical protein
LPVARKAPSAPSRQRRIFWGIFSVIDFLLRNAADGSAFADESLIGHNPPLPC